MDSKGAVEAALFSSSRPMRVKEVADKTGLSDQTVRKALADLAEGYDSAGSAVMVSKINSMYSLRLRDEYIHFTDRFSDMEIPPATMKTLSTIAYNQPVLQSELFRARGVRTYEDVRELMSMGFVAGKKTGQTLELTTTKRFAEYFGIEGGRIQDVKAWIEKNQGH